MSSCAVSGIPPEMLALIGTALAATGGPLTAKEHRHFGCGALICTVDASGKVEVNSRLAKMRRMRQPRPPIQRSARQPMARPRAARAPRRRRTAGTKTAASRAGPGSDPDPEPLTVPEIQTPNAGSPATAEVRPTMSNLIRFPLRRIAAVLVVRERGGGWLALAGEHGWVFGSYAEAYSEAKWLSRNRGLPVRVIGGAP